MKQFDYLIVGAGLYGATFARCATMSGKKCLLVDKRPHSGGNLYCESIEGINVHKYGAHIFHTSDARVWKFVNGIVPFNRFTNSPLACYKGDFYNLPFNMNTFYKIWGVKTPEEAKLKIESQKAEVLSKMKERGTSVPENLEEQALLLVGSDIYKILIKDYTEKQWGRPCGKLPPFIIKRLPIRFTFDNNYFNDAYQGVPIGGYNKLISGLLAGSEVLLNTDFFENKKKLLAAAEQVVFTGKIDEFFDYRFGKLEYRTVRFDTQVLSLPNYQGNAVVNYTGADVPYTRIIEHKHFESFGQDVYSNPNTVISKEYSVEWEDGFEPYYPINDEKNSGIYLKYKELAESSSVIFGGRLAEYKYYDMAPIVGRVLDFWGM